MRVWLGLVTALLLASAGIGTAAAQPEAGGGLERVVWFDGTREHEVWQSAAEVIEFVPVGSAATSRGLGEGRAAGGFAVRFWRVEELENRVRERSLAAGTSKGRLSPVFHRSSAGGSRLGINGTLMIRFNADMDDAEIRQWLAAQQLSLVSRMAGAGIYLVRVAEGVAVLDVVNRISRLEEVKYAAPDWWQELSRR